LFALLLPLANDDDSSGGTGTGSAPRAAAAAATTAGFDEMVMPRWAACELILDILLRRLRRWPGVAVRRVVSGMLSSDPAESSWEEEKKKRRKNINKTQKNWTK
jgi:hypothetical protein